MTYRPHRLVALLCGLFILGLCIGVASAAEKGGACYPMASLKVAMKMVLLDDQVELTGAEARAYIAEFNGDGNPTAFAAERILLQRFPPAVPILMGPRKLRRGPWLGVLFDAAGKGCKRILVGPFLHMEIMRRLARSAL